MNEDLLLGFRAAFPFHAARAYRLSTGVKVWVITEADRSVTTLLLPDEY
jgi:hypothetical protein